MSVDVTQPLRPRHRRSPRARRLAAQAENAGPGTPQPHLAAFAVAETEVDLTGRGAEVVAYVAKAAMEAMPAGPVHLAVGADVIHHADHLSLTGLRRRLAQPAPPPDPAGATFTLAVSDLISETVPPEPGQIGTLVIGATVERPAIVRLRGGEPGIAVRSLARLTFAYDHRTLGRAPATQFLTAVKHRLEKP